MPVILAPAGNRASFLAALAAGADAVYCGLKNFSARMEAKNFSIEELAALTALAHDEGAKVFIPFNTLVKPGELERAAKLVSTLRHQVHPDGLIIQDLGVLDLVRQSGFRGEIHLSTLANVSFPEALAIIRSGLGVDRVVVPRELNIDEIKQMAAACPPGLALEVFVHGALCYSVSGRCYWSSYMGGKSGLRGRCVQPCRRVYQQGGAAGRTFSCQDLSLDVLAKVLKEVPRVATWKIEGRKKGPHYVYYTVRAYRLLRDEGTDPEMKRAALQLLDRALGRPGTHYHFLPQRPQNPVNLDRKTGSGFLIGTVKGTRPKTFFSPREDLLVGDVLRVGYEDDRWHAVYRLKKHIPKRGRFYLNPVAGKTPEKGAPVFLTDRREKGLADRIGALEKRLREPLRQAPSKSPFRLKLPDGSRRRTAVSTMDVSRGMRGRKIPGGMGFWLSQKAVSDVPRDAVSRSWWWLPAVVWPDNTADVAVLLAQIRKKGARNFVLNAPWQTGYFSGGGKVNLWAGPFCNLANPLAFKTVASMGFAGAIISPELDRKECLALPRHSPIPLGIVIAGNWPLCVSRVLADGVKIGEPFASPKGEQAWVAKHGVDYWVFPNWRLDLTARETDLRKAGYSLFVTLTEPLPEGVKMKKRPGMWNWDGKLL